MRSCSLIVKRVPLVFKTVLSSVEHGMLEQPVSDFLVGLMVSAVMPSSAVTMSEQPQTV